MRYPAVQLRIDKESQAQSLEAFMNSQGYTVGVPKPLVLAHEPAIRFGTTGGEEYVAVGHGEDVLVFTAKVNDNKVKDGFNQMLHTLRFLD